MATNTKPTLPGYQIEDLIGEGVCGRVWAAEDPVGNKVAVRTLNVLSVNLEIVREMARRLDGLGLDGHGPMPIWLQALDLRPAMLVTPLIGKWVEDKFVPASLQAKLSNYLGKKEAEPLVRCLAKAMAGCHRHRVVHGNLKPGNVFISDEGRVYVGDYGMGWMPGLDFLAYTDAILYMSPEQLRHPSGLVNEEGYRWDVYSFGTLAYRLLEGAFPRCHESFDDVAPKPGVLHKEGIEADFEGVAEQVFAEPLRPWEKESDPILRGIVERCLSLDPNERFRDMVELCDYWERESLLARHAIEMEVVGKKLRQGRKVKKRLVTSLVACGGVAAALGGGWLYREGKTILALREMNEERSFAVQARNRAQLTLQNVEQSQVTTKAELNRALEEVGLLTNGQGRLVEWALSEGGGKMPVLVERSDRLQVLAENYEKLLAEISASDELRRQWESQLALVNVAMGLTREARERVGGEVARLGGRGLSELLLRESELAPVSEKELALARNMAKREGGDRAKWLGVVLDLAEARSLEHSQGPEQALRVFSRMLPNFEKLHAMEPGTGILWRTRVRSEAATMADGVGDDRLAVLFREQALEELRNLLGADGLSDEMKQQLKEEFVIATAGLSEAYYGAGRLEPAQSLATEAIMLLRTSQRDEARIALAVNHAVMAGCDRERSHGKAAENSLKEALALLEEPAEESMEHLRLYREGIFRWQMGVLQGQLNRTDEELGFIQAGHKLLTELLEKKDSQLRPSEHQIHHALGYLCADLADSLDDKDASLAALDQAIASWKILLAARPDDDEYREGLAWCESKKGSPVE